jgi:hypothetical protein
VTLFFIFSFVRAWKILVFHLLLPIVVLFLVVANQKYNFWGNLHRVALFYPQKFSRSVVKIFTFTWLLRKVYFGYKYAQLQQCANKVVQNIEETPAL